MEKKRQIINIVNFIRGFDSEPQPELETYKTVKNQIELIDKYNFKATFLIQYDALQMKHFRELMLSLDKNRYEIGVWFEVIKPLAEDAGVKWNCDREWSGACNCGYAMAYPNNIREKMIDLVFEQFKGIFGYYPKVFGAWFYDTYTIRYIADKYGLDALCNCKEQFGTDGYTLWGGYYGQAYYPSRKNVFLPAQKKDNQIDIPLFKMLGSDQVYQYDCAYNEDLSPKKSQCVITLEPVYHDIGGELNEWVDWYLKENFNGECLSFGYAQAGQENSFGWQKMKDGLRYQFALFDELQKQGKIEIEQLGESGRWFKEKYNSTPASAITAHSAYDDENKNTAWYCCKNYRINLYSEDGKIRIRDLHIFDDSIEDPFEHEVCKKTFAVYETLPVVDGYLFSGNSVRSGAFFSFKDGKDFSCKEMKFIENDEKCCDVIFKNDNDFVKFFLSENEVKITSNKDFEIENVIGRESKFVPTLINNDNKKITFKYLEKEYGIELLNGEFLNNKKIISESSKITLSFFHKNDIV
ncbi:MAG: hypothetical protein IJR70_08010 [Eubacterium sp.]|nr:hypothetical protein [Eubacterium sp.]